MLPVSNTELDKAYFVLFSFFYSYLMGTSTIESVNRLQEGPKDLRAGGFVETTHAVTVSGQMSRRQWFGGQLSLLERFCYT